MMETNIHITFKGNFYANVVCLALLPDNIDFPKNLKLSTLRKGRNLSFLLTSSGTVGTLISTIEDLLESCQLSLNVLSIVSKFNHDI